MTHIKIKRTITKNKQKNFIFVQVVLLVCLFENFQIIDDIGFYRSHTIHVTPFCRPSMHPNAISINLSQV